VLDVIKIGGQDAAVQAARNYRTLRSLGITVRKTIDTQIGTCFAVGSLPVLCCDRDFDPFLARMGPMTIGQLP